MERFESTSPFSILLRPTNIVQALFGAIADTLDNNWVTLLAAQGRFPAMVSGRYPLLFPRPIPPQNVTGVRRHHALGLIGRLGTAYMARTR